MKIHRHPLLPAAPGTRREITTLHFGTPGSGPKALIQASLHADEVPPMLVAQHLRGALGGLERAGRLRGEIVLIPVANPIGLGQRLLEQPVGRFDLASGENFNRHYANLFEIVRHQLEDRLGGDERANIASLRALLRDACAQLSVHTELQSMRHVLLSLAVDADTVLDLHCDNEALLHLYTTPSLWHAVEPLARELQCPLALLADGSGDDPFDEACSLTWQRLAAHLAAAHPGVAAGPGLAQACVAATVELRGEADVSHAQAAADARGLLRYLMQRGHIEPDADFGRSPTPPSGAPRPLAGSMPVVAPIGGVLLYLRELGATLAEGEPFAEIIDPVSGQTVTVASPVDGLFFARDARRYVAAGIRIAKISGTQARRRGKLMSA
jgi:predicted deacylase